MKYEKNGKQIDVDFVIGLNYDGYTKDDSWYDEFDENYAEKFSRKANGVSGEGNVNFAFVYTYEIEPGEEDSAVEIIPPFVSFIGFTGYDTNADRPYLCLMSSRKTAKLENLYDGSPSEFMDRITGFVERFYDIFGDEPDFVDRN